MSNQDLKLPSKIVSRGEDIDLQQLDPTLRNLYVGVGWDLIGFEDGGIDLDLSAFLLNPQYQTRMDSDFVFYNNLSGAEDSVLLSGDNRTGAGDGDDEDMSVSLSTVPFDIVSIVFALTIYEGDNREQSFKNVRNCYLRICNKETGVEMLRFTLDDVCGDSPKATALKVAELKREGSAWHFVALGECLDGGLHDLAESYGLLVN